jgi:hypothetical protein
LHFFATVAVEYAAFGGTPASPSFSAGLAGRSQGRGLARFGENGPAERVTRPCRTLGRGPAARCKTGTRALGLTVPNIVGADEVIE